MITKIEVKEVSPLTDKPDGPLLFAGRRAVTAGIKVTSRAMWDERYPHGEAHAREKVRRDVAMELYGDIDRGLQELFRLTMGVAISSSPAFNSPDVAVLFNKISEMRSRIEALWREPTESKGPPAPELLTTRQLFEAFVRDGGELKSQPHENDLPLGGHKP